MDTVLLLLSLLFPALLILAAVLDLTTMTIPNGLNLLLAGAFFPAAVIAGFDVATIGLHVAAAIAVLAVCFAMFALGWMGGGDAKLAAATTLWIGPTMPLLTWAIYGAIYGGVLTLVLLALRQVPLPLALAGRPWIARLHDPRTGVPYGIALAAAGLNVYPHLDIFARLAA